MAILSLTKATIEAEGLAERDVREAFLPELLMDASMGPGCRSLRLYSTSRVSCLRASLRNRSRNLLVHVLHQNWACKNNAPLARLETVNPMLWPRRTCSRASEANECNAQSSTSWPPCHQILLSCAHGWLHRTAVFGRVHEHSCIQTSVCLWSAPARRACLPSNGCLTRFSSARNCSLRCCGR